MAKAVEQTDRAPNKSASVSCPVRDSTQTAARPVRVAHLNDFRLWCLDSLSAHLKSPRGAGPTRLHSHGIFIIFVNVMSLLARIHLVENSAHARLA
jgi:hypothetical protein